MGSAYVNHRDHDTGSIEPGKLADLVVLDRDLLDRGAGAIGEARVATTLVEGDVVYEVTSSLARDHERIRQSVLLEVRCRADTVDHREEARRGEGSQHAVPRVAQDVDPLPRRRTKGAHVRRLPFVIRCHDHEKRIRGHRNERLGSFRMPFNQCQCQGKGARLCAEDADPGAALRAEVEPGAIVEPLTQPLVDDPIRRAGGLEHVADRGQICGGQRLDPQAAVIEQ